MNGVSRFLSRRERDRYNERRAAKRASKSQTSNSNVPSELYKVLTRPDGKSADKDGDKKVKMLLTRLQGAGITQLKEAHAEYANTVFPDDLDKAYDLLILANETFEGELKDFDENVPLLGAVNRDMTTCYLDALLFAMFARLDSFEAMLYDGFEDDTRKTLAGCLRLWVNLLRTGQLIGVDVTKHLQDALAEAGWKDAALTRQQDASEAFTFITGVLNLPLLTLKMDIFHTGHESKEDDHKFVNERLLEVAIPQPQEGQVLTLEDCLETYFNNRIEVKRYLQRQNTLPDPPQVENETEKNQTILIEALEISGSESPLSATPTTPVISSPSKSVRPGRRRAESIFSERHSVSDGQSKDKPFDEKSLLKEILQNSSGGRPRSTSFMRKEVMMPAWQFFSLIPWYTDNVPKSDAQVAAHFSSKRPILGVCLKRYMTKPNGEAKRLNTYVDIPLEIGLPHFISDDRMQDEGPLFGNFKLVLQSVVCHRGKSVNSGHYVSLVRANKAFVKASLRTADTEEKTSAAWLKFDDLANPRVTEVDIKQALCNESPYLLFFQVQPIDEELATRGDPPSYSEVHLSSTSAELSKETLTLDMDGTTLASEIGSDVVKRADTDPDMVRDEAAATSEAAGRSSLSSQRQSVVANDDANENAMSTLRGRSEPPTPEEQKPGFLSTSRRNSRSWLAGKSRPNSQSGENRISLSISRLTGRASKDKIGVPDDNLLDEQLVIVNEIRASPVAEDTQRVSSPVKEKKDFGLGRNRSRRERKDEKKEEKRRLRSKSREPPLDPMATKKKFKAKERPDRECAVM